MTIIHKILSRQEFIEQPPVLLDIGASQSINPKWKTIAKYSICIAFDADSRDFEPDSVSSGTYRKLFVYNSLVADVDNEKADFHLTKSPHCSSFLKPDQQSLGNWAFADLFQIEETLQLKSTTLKVILDDLKISYIDWFKTDSQGIDLRLFRSLESSIIQKILVAEFEPGLIDAYHGEDKFYNLLSYMQSHPFWISEMNIKGSQRITPQSLMTAFNSFECKNVEYLLKTSPGWVEVSFVNNLKNNIFTKRDLLLAWIFAVLDQQYGFALEVVDICLKEFAHDRLFDLMKQWTLAKVRSHFYRKISYIVYRKILQKLSQFRESIQ